VEVVESESDFGGVELGDRVGESLGGEKEEEKKRRVVFSTGGS